MLWGRRRLRAGHEREALGAFGQALFLKPQLTAARLGSARALLRKNKPEESLALLQEMFAEAGAAKGPTSAITEARRLYAEAQEVLVQRDLHQMRQAVKEFGRRLEQQGGVPIRFCEAEDVLGIDRGRLGQRPRLPCPFLRVRPSRTHDKPR